MRRFEVKNLSVRRRLRLEVSTLSSGKPPVCTPFQVQ